MDPRCSCTKRYFPHTPSLSPVIHGSLERCFSPFTGRVVHLRKARDCESFRRRPSPWDSSWRSTPLRERSPVNAAFRLFITQPLYPSRIDCRAPNFIHIRQEFGDTTWDSTLKRTFQSLMGRSLSSQGRRAYTTHSFSSFVDCVKRIAALRAIKTGLVSVLQPLKF